jgi:hypothetical protein
MCRGLTWHPGSIIFGQLKVVFYGRTPPTKQMIKPICRSSRLRKLSKPPPDEAFDLVRGIFALLRLGVKGHF